jgi:hypothetical protein
MLGILPRSTLTKKKTKERKQSQINIQETSNSLQTQTTKERRKHMREPISPQVGLSLREPIY